MSGETNKQSPNGGLLGVVFRHETRKVAPQVFALMNKTSMAQGEGDQVFVQGNAGILVSPFSNRISKAIECSVNGDMYLLGFYGNLWVDAQQGKVAPDIRECLVSLVRSYVRKGTEFLYDLEGDFALVLWDSQKQLLILATDPCRIYPLFYYHDQEKFVFSSRLTALGNIDADVQLTVSPLAIIDVVGSSYIPTPATIFKEAYKLPPGQVLTYHKGIVDMQSYWNIDFSRPIQAPLPDLKKELKKFFRNSIKKRLNPDRNNHTVGTFLSGGVDSSTVTGVLSAILERPVKTFTIGFAHEQYNEVEYARCAARSFHTDHHEYFVTPADTFDALPRLLSYFDEPFGNASAIPTFFCSQMAREHGVQILLAGDGGDELFAGNERYATQRVFDYYHVLPQWFRQRLLEPGVKNLAHLIPISLFRKGQKYINRANIPYPDRLNSWGVFEILSPDKLFHPEFCDALLTYIPHRELFRHYAQAPANTELDRQLYVDLKMAISDNDLFKVTKMTELAGVDVRFPFLDRAVMEFAAKLPANVKMKGTQLRSFFKWAYSDLLPLEIRKKKKHGFGLPISYWLKNFKPMNDLMHDLILSERTYDRQIFLPKTLKELVRSHETDRTPFFGAILWNVMVLEMWLRQYEEGGGHIQ